jgi:DNA-binding GntR family transcriptional regulator
LGVGFLKSKCLKTDKIEFSTKSELVYKTLKDQIITGQLKPGRRFSASELAVELGVSRTPVNDAVRLLADQGLIRMLPNKGFEIKSLSWTEIEEVMHIRLQLEKLAVTWAINRASAEKIKELVHLSGLMRKAVLEHNKRDYYLNNNLFHNTLYKAARAPRLFDLHQRIWVYEGWYVAQLDGLSERLLLLCDDHDEIISAMLKENTSKAHQVIERHVQNCLQIISENLRAAGYQYNFNA